MATSTTFILKQHDLEPPVDGQLKNADGTAINLTTATAVYFVMRPSGGGSTIRRAATVVTPNPDFSSSPDAVHVRYSWASGDTDTANTYNQEWEIIWPTARPQTVPNSSYNQVVIQDDLD